MATNKLSDENSTLKSKALQPSSQAEMDQALAVLTAHKDAWATMDIPGRIGLLDQIMQDIPGVEERWLAASMAAKENQPESYGAAVDWYSITVIYRYIRFLRKAFQDILQYGKPKIPGKVSTRANGQVVAQVVPYDWKEASWHYRESVLKSGWIHPFLCKMAAFPRHLIIRAKITKDRFVLCLAQGTSVR